jgi:hypothetical protein
MEELSSGAVAESFNLQSVYENEPELRFKSKFTQNETQK